MSLAKICCVLFVLFSLTFSAAATPFNHGGLRFITGGRNISGPLGSPFTVEPLWLPTFADLPLPQSPSKPKEISRELEAEFKETLLLLWHITLRDSKLLYSKAQRNLENSCASGLATVKVWLKGALNGLLWAVIFIWSSLIWAMCCWIFYLVTTFTMPVVCIVLLYAFTTFMVRALAWTLSGWPISLAKCIYKAGKIIFTVPKFKRNYVEEKEVKGFTSIKIPQQPPRACVLEIQYDDASHAGYASCVRLYDGTLGLMTAQHVCDAAVNGKVASTKTPNKIPLSQFTPLIISQKGDFALLSGPPNWESLLGCKGAMFVPASQLAKSKMRFHFIEKNEWMADHGEVVGPRDSWFAATLCNSQPGHSGTPIFNGKMILGVHVGADKDENHNLMATIPPVPGITSPQYVFETTAPQGRVFNDEDIDEMLKSISKSIPRLQDFKSITGKNWADYDEEKKAAEKKVQQEAAKPSSSKNQGNEGGRAVCQNNSKTEKASSKKALSEGKAKEKEAVPAKSTPSKPAESVAAEGEMFEKMLSKLVERIDLSTIEKKVVEIVAAKAMKKPKGSQRRKRPQKASKDTSEANTSGKYQPPHKRSQGSKSAAPSPATTDQSKSKVVSGAPSSSKNTQSWVRKSPASAGRS
uniref:P1 protein n=1 Tax=Pepper vein yellows virus 10 TaxID=3073889 RepID=A0AA51YFF6_9VIRU|nr:P1 protein [Pepper vein yellows virus 10]